MKWKCWNTEKPETIHRIEADSLDEAAVTARMIDQNVNAFQPEDDEE